MTVDFQEILKDKRAWVIAGGAGLVGLVVFLKRGGSGSGNNSAPTPAAGTAGATGGVVTADTTGTDIASYLSQVQQQNQAQFQEWDQNLSDTLKAIQGAGTTMTGNSGAGSSYGGYTRNSDGTYSVPVGGGVNWANLQQQLAGLNLNGDIQTLINLNPGLMTDVSNYKDNGGVWQNVFKNPITLKVPVLNPPKS